MITKLRALDRSSHTATVGIGLAVITAVVSGFSVFLNASAVRSVGDPVLFTTLKNGVAAVLLASIAAALVPDAGRRIRGLDRRAIIGLVVLGVVGGSIPFVLFFTGLAQASAPAAAVIHKTLFVWVALLGVVLLGERLGRLQLAALAVLLLSQLLIQPPDGVGWTSGETLIGMATLLWAVEVIVAKRVLTGVPSHLAAVARMGIGLGVLAAYAAISGSLSGLGALGAEQWVWIVGTGVLLTAYVATWYAALQRAPATAVTAVLTIAVPVTAVLQLVANGQVPAPGAVAGYAGTLLAAAVVAIVAMRPRPASVVAAPA